MTLPSLGPLALAGVLVLVPLARAHDSHGNANWIAKEHRTSPIDGSHCCGEHDCRLLDSEEVTALGGGFYLKNYNEVVPQFEVQVSRDGNYWRCKKGDGSRRCFFAPPPST